MAGRAHETGLLQPHTESYTRNRSRHLVHGISAGTRGKAKQGNFYYWITLVNKIMYSLEGGYAPKGSQKEDTLDFQKSVNLGVQEQWTGLKAKINLLLGKV